MRFARFGLSQSRSVAALAFHHLVALLDQALAFAILAFGLLLDIRAFFIGHDILHGKVRPTASPGWAKTSGADPRAYNTRMSPGSCGLLADCPASTGKSLVLFATSIALVLPFRPSRDRMREKSKFMKQFNVDSTVQMSREKYLLLFFRNRWHVPRHPASTRRGVSRSS
jgi:hypothetical protein